jgi:hypothetical protein
MDNSQFRRGRALLGFMGEQDVRNFLNGACVIENQNELDVYMEEWRRAAESVSRLKLRVLSPVNQQELSLSHSDHVRQLILQPGFKQLFGANFALREVALENLVAFQRYVDAEHSVELATTMGSDEQSVLNCCLPLQFKQDLQITYDQTVPGVTFSSVSPKLQLAGLQLLGVGGPEVTIGGQQLAQPGVLFVIGTQPNYVQVARYKDRYFLKNGYHRAYAALLANRKHIPAVVSEFEDFIGVGALNPGFFPKELLMNDAPPLVPDLLNQEIALDVKLKPMRKMIRVRVDEFLAPR